MKMRISSHSHSEGRSLVGLADMTITPRANLTTGCTQCTHTSRGPSFREQAPHGKRGPQPGQREAPAAPEYFRPKSSCPQVPPPLSRPCVVFGLTCLYGDLPETPWAVSPNSDAPPHGSLPPAEWDQTVLFHFLDLYHKSPDSGERQYKSRMYTRQSDQSLEKGEVNLH